MKISFGKVPCELLFRNFRFGTSCAQTLHLLVLLHYEFVARADPWARLQVPPRASCAPFCALSASKTVALGSNVVGEEIARTGAENQHDSKPSQSMSEGLLTTDKGEVGGFKSSQAHQIQKSRGLK